MSIKRVRKLLGARIRNLRKERGLTQEALAEKADLHGSYIGLIERAEKSPSLETLYKIAETFNISIPDLLIEENNVDTKKKQLFGIIRDKSCEEIETLYQISRVIFK